MELSAIVLRQLDAIGIKPRDEPSGVTDQLENVLPHCRLPARKGDLRDARRAALIDDRFPLFGRKLPLIRKLLPRRIAVHALLVAVPLAVLGHGAHHGIHAVRRIHIFSIFADTHIVDIRGHFLTVSDLLDRGVNGLNIFRDALSRKNRDDALHALHGIT